MGFFSNWVNDFEDQYNQVVQKENNIVGDDIQNILFHGHEEFSNYRDDKQASGGTDTRFPTSGEAPPPKTLGQTQAATAQDKAAAIRDPILINTMPDLNDTNSRSAARKRRAALLQRGGRNSTILTGDPLGGGL